jgi:paired amphipathic helix protein Sin3a
MYLRSLDHQGIQVKQSDKKHFSAKHLVDAIKTKHEEHRRQQKTTGSAPKYQYLWQFEDKSIIVDVLRLMVMYVANASQHNNLERHRIREFFIKFIPTFFDISEDVIADSIRDIERATPDDDSEDVAPLELPNGGRGRRIGNGKKTDLRRGVLDKNQNRNGNGKGRSHKEDSATGSKESTPDVDSVGEDDAGEMADDQAVTEVANGNWAGVATPVDTRQSVLHTEDLDFSADQPFSRDYYKLWSNQTIFVFMSLFQTLYDRLKDIKASEEEARGETIRLRFRSIQKRRLLPRPQRRNLLLPNTTARGRFHKWRGRRNSVSSIHSSILFDEGLAHLHDTGLLKAPLQTWRSLFKR